MQTQEDFTKPNAFQTINQRNQERALLHRSWSNIVLGAVTAVFTTLNSQGMSVHVQGISTGASIPVGIKQVSSLTASTTVSVVSTYACLTKISVVAYTGASWLRPPASISPIGAVTAQLLPLQVTLLQTSVLDITVRQWISRCAVKHMHASQILAQSLNLHCGSWKILLSCQPIMIGIAN